MEAEDSKAKEESRVTVVLLSGAKVQADVEAAPVGIYDIIRQDIRKMSTVQPVDRIFLERTELGYRGVLYSHDRPYIFALNGHGCLVKPLDANDVSVLQFCTKLEEVEQQQTAVFAAQRADAEQDDFNRVMQEHSLQPNADMTAVAEDGPEYTLRMHGPTGDDFIERIPGTYRKRMQGAFLERIRDKRDKETTGVCGGAVITRHGKVLLVKPANGFGGYDWTFPKGYPEASDEGHLERTARREASEETGYRVFAKRYIGRFTHNDGGTCDYFECDVDSSKPVGVPDEETAEVRWVTVVEALDLLNDDVDVKILAQANRLVPELILKGGHSGTMIALHLPNAIAKKLAIKGGEDAKDLHITLAYLGKGLSDAQKKRAAIAVRKFAGAVDGIDVTLGGVGRFSASDSSEGRDVIYLSVDSPQLTKLHPHLMELLADVGLQPSGAHGWIPHVTLAYVAKNDRTPIERLEPIAVHFDKVALTIGGTKMSFPLKLSEANRRFIEIGRRNYEAIMALKVAKALPRMSDDERDAANKKVGAKPIGAATKTLGAGGKVRYNYPGEKGGDKKPQPGEGGAAAAANGQSPEGAQQQEEKELPHPDLPPPPPDQEPIAAEHPEKPSPDDVRAPDPTEPQAPKHTLNVQELCAALGIQRDVLQQIVERMKAKFGAQARQKFASFLRTHVKEFADEHGLDGDYFGLLFDVLSGKVPEGQPAAVVKQQQAQEMAK